MTFAPARPAMHILGLAQGVEYFAKGRVSILGLVTVKKLLAQNYKRKRYFTSFFGGK